MAKLSSPLSARIAVALAACAGAGACANANDDGVALSKATAIEIPKVPIPSEHGPKLASVADLTPILDRPGPGAKKLGYLHAGGRVARAEQPYSREGCSEGWFPVRPAGFVCAGGSATLDLKHPTLAAMAIQPLFDQPLPYTYARTIADTPLYERRNGEEAHVQEIGKLKRRAGMAVVGSWSAKVPGGGTERLALLTSGKFVKASDLEAAAPSEFAGVELDGKSGLPVGFVVKRGVRSFKLDGEDAKIADDLDVHQKLSLTGRFRSAHGEKFWAIEKDRWVRNKDVTVVQARSVFPDFAVEGQKWLDVSVVMGTVVAYEGKRPFFVTLLSVGRTLENAKPTDPPPQNGEVPVITAPTSAWGLGTFEVRAKHVTLVGADPFVARENHQLLDLPWAFELSSGRMGYAAYWHDRFGVEHGPGALELSPADAVRLWQWITPNVPEGWHGRETATNEPKTLVVLRK
jgi:hypothetical protein